MFRDAFDGVCGVLDGLLGCSLRDVVFGVGVLAGGRFGVVRLGLIRVWEWVVG